MSEFFIQCAKATLLPACIVAGLLMAPETTVKVFPNATKGEVPVRFAMPCRPRGGYELRKF